MAAPPAYDSSGSDSELLGDDAIMAVSKSASGSGSDTATHSSSSASSSSSSPSSSSKSVGAPVPPPAPAAPLPLAAGTGSGWKLHSKQTYRWLPLVSLAVCVALIAMASHSNAIVALVLACVFGGGCFLAILTFTNKVSMSWRQEFTYGLLFSSMIFMGVGVTGTYRWARWEVLNNVQLWEVPAALDDDPEEVSKIARKFTDALLLAQGDLNVQTNCILQSPEEGGRYVCRATCVTPVVPRAMATVKRAEWATHSALNELKRIGPKTWAGCAFQIHLFPDPSGGKPKVDPATLNNTVTCSNICAHERIREGQQGGILFSMMLPELAFVNMLRGDGWKFGLEGSDRSDWSKNLVAGEAPQDVEDGEQYYLEQVSGTMIPAETAPSGGKFPDGTSFRAAFNDHISTLSRQLGWETFPKKYGEGNRAVEANLVDDGWFSHECTESDCMMVLDVGRFPFVWLSDQARTDFWISAGVVGGVAVLGSFWLICR
jgi:hypothetical protein